MKKEKFDYIFIILIYRNYNDLDECLLSIKQKVCNYKTIVIDAFYSEESSQAIKEIADKYDCDYLCVENKGYSYGNNMGLEHAEMYEYKYVVISNPDIVIQTFDNNILNKRLDIIAPKIKTLSGKNQNPSTVFENKLSERFVYNGLKKNHKLTYILGLAFGKAGRIVGRTIISPKHFAKVFGAHGSFVLISRRAVQKLGIRIYDENMFLFGEEGVLSIRAKKNNLKIIYTDTIEIKHKEDGSMKLADFSINDALKQSNIYYYEKYRIGNDYN